MKFYFIIVFLLLVGSSQATTLTVCPGGCGFASIQDAINVSNDGDVIEVQSGFYNEQITINKDVTLKGIDTGEGWPFVYVIYLCKHPDSVISRINSIIRVGSCPGKEKSIYNNTVIIRKPSEPPEITEIGPSLDFKGEPAFTVEVQADKSDVDSGDLLSLNLFISGAGDVNTSKLRVSIPPYIVQNNNVIMSEVLVFQETSTGEDNDTSKLPYFYRLRARSTNETLLRLELGKSYFKNYSNSLINIGENPLPVQINKTYPPFIVLFKISDKAPAGDHNIYVDLFYKNKDKWQLDRQIVPIHVRYWYESGWLQFFVYLALILGAGASFACLNESRGLKKFLKVIMACLIELPFLREIKNKFKRLIFGPRLYYLIAGIKNWYQKKDN